MRILIADNQTMMRDGLRALLANEVGIEVLDTVADTYWTLLEALELIPDIVILDICMPGQNGIDAIRSIKRKHRSIGVVVLTDEKDQHSVQSALDAGADSYVLKTERHSELMRAISSVAAGKNYLSPGARDQVVTKTPIGRSWEQLTPREKEVLQLVAAGYRTRQIAEQLNLSHKTIEKHRANFMRKLDLHNVAAVTAYAIRNGII